MQIKNKWQSELGEYIENETLTQRKIIIRYCFFNPKQNGKYKSRTKRSVCGEQSANYLHVFWLCPKLLNFWTEVFLFHK